MVEIEVGYIFSIGLCALILFIFIFAVMNLINMDSENRVVLNVGKSIVWFVHAVTIAIHYGTSQTIFHFSTTGGIRHETYKATLKKIPATRLSRLTEGN